jgi:hypothetical protein
MVENKMPKMMSMKDFLASGGAAVKAYKNTGVVPSYVATGPKPTRPKNAPTPSFSRLNKGSKGKRTSNTISAGAGAMKKKKKTAPVKKKTYSGM